jgi:hypothetical protein
MSPVSSDRRAAAAMAGALVFCASYAVQRLLASDDPAGVLLARHVPLTWRVAVAALHGGTATLLVGMAVPPERILRHTRVAWGVVLLCIAAAVWAK